MHLEFKNTGLKATGVIILLQFFLAVFEQANASTIYDFNAAYQISNWNQSLHGGVIDVSGAPETITLISSDSDLGATNTDIVITAASNGMVSFDWFFNTVDIDGPLYDPFGWILNNVFTQLTDDSGLNTQSGSVKFDVLQGEVFGFRAFSVDSIFGSASTTISSFSAPVSDTNSDPNSVPVPASIWFFIPALMGLLGFNKKITHTH